MGLGLLQHVTSVGHVAGHVVHLRFGDGVEGDFYLREVIGEFTGALAPLADPEFVAQVFVNERRIISWPGELDLDPVVLYCAVRGVPVPAYGNRSARRTEQGPRGRKQRVSSHEPRRGRKAGA